MRKKQKWPVLTLVAALGCAGAMGCDGGSSDNQTDGGKDSGATEAGGEAGAGDSGGSGGATFGSGSNFSSVKEYFKYVNDKRNSYASHTRWKGFPFSGGSYHKNVTWPYTMTWSAAAAAAAQKEADAVAGGATPSGKATMNNPGQLPIYVSGLNTVDYMVGGKERSGSFTTSTCTLCNSNPFMRMAVFYHDPGGDGPVLKSLGIGAADLGDGSTWWVMRFAK
jgi:hypothetical protein